MILEIGAGFAALIAGGDLLVRGAASGARRLGVSPLVIGLTIVGFGTSMPELMTSVQAVLANSPGIAVGNIVGSNICNILLILGLAALLSPIRCGRDMLIRDGGWLMGSAIILALLAWYGWISRPVGLLLVLGLAAYMGYLFALERRRTTLAVQARARTSSEGAGSFQWPGFLLDVALVAAGLVLVTLGGRWLVSGAIDLARIFEVSEAVIGLTVVAVGTSLPELATSIIAGLKRQTDIALGNILGSNIHNALGIAGVTALVKPVAIPAEMIRFDIPVMLAASLLLIVIAFTDRRITRLEGAVCVSCYAVYIWMLRP